MKTELISILIATGIIILSSWRGIYLWKKRKYLAKLTTVHLSGVGFDLVEGQYFAKYWKNGVATIVEGAPDSMYADVSSITISGKDVYIGGEGENSTPKYWKNGTAVNIGDVAKKGYVNGIAVSGNDVYCVGSLRDGSALFYWKNNVRIPLSDDKEYGETNAITIVGNDIYIAGYVYSSNKVYIAKYWKNGVVTDLGDGIRDLMATAITVVGSDVYVAGVLLSDPIDNDPRKPVYWKNGSLIKLEYPLNDPEESWAYAFNQTSGISVVGTDVYVSGMAVDRTKKPFTVTACYWKNTKLITLGNGEKFSVAYGITAVGNDVYVVGFETEPSGKVPKCWKNGVAVNIGNGFTYGEVRAIAVV